jgi:hypothetical protein
MGPGILARRSGALWPIALGVLVLLLSASPASADLELCPPGEGAGQCGAPPSIGAAERGLAVDIEEDLLYVADETNNRINVFEADGDFVFAFGYGVADGTTNTFQTCTTTCFKGIAGAGAGQFDRPVAVAVDNDPASLSKHAIYVSELGKDEGIGNGQHPRVQKLEPTGEFVWMVGKGVDKTDGGDLCTQAEGHVCGQSVESSAEGGFVAKPTIATGPGGVIYVVDNIRVSGNTIKQRLQRFEPSGSPISPQVTLLEDQSVFARAAAVDAAGDLWVASQEDGLRKHDPDTGTTLAGPFEAGVNFASNGLAIDAGGNLYAGQLEGRDNGSGSLNAITAFDSTGNVFRRFAYTVADGGSNPINGLAAHASAFGELFLSQAREGITYTFEPPPGPLPAPPSLEVPKPGSLKATLLVEVNPEGKATEVHFEYLTQKAYEEEGEEFAGPDLTSTPAEALGAEGFNLKAADAIIGCPNPATEPDKCLSAATVYRWRVVATNADNLTGSGEGTVEGPPFETGRPIEIGELYATRVGTDTARLSVEANPNAIPATGYFEYVADAAFQEDLAKGLGHDGFAAAIKVPDKEKGQKPVDFGSGEAFVTRQVTISALTPGTIYHYRLVAENSQTPAPVKGDAEELHTFEPPEAENCTGNQTSRIGSGSFLPDCRAYEMVSPVDKEGGDIRVGQTSVAQLAVLEQSSVSGERLAYGSIRSFGDAASAPFTSQYIAQRVAGRAWETHPINPPRGAPIVTALNQFDTEFKAFSADLCQSWLTTYAEPPLAEAARARYSNLYRRTDELCREDGKAGFEALAPISKPASLSGPDFFMSLLGVSADGEHAAFTASDKISSQGKAGQHQLYEAGGGQAPRLICILPAAQGGSAVSGSCRAGSTTPESDDPGAQIGRVSSEGERIFWSAPAGNGKIYVRIGGTQTVAVSEGGEEESDTTKFWFWGAAADGSKAIFSALDTEAGVSDLYEFDVDSKETNPIAGGVLGVMGISEDAARVYFASTEVLSGEANNNGDKPEAGEPNLYLREGDGNTQFVATLGSADLGQAVLPEPFRKHTALVSPDGAHAAFVSAASPTGYDNKGAESGVRTGEVYRYDAAENELSCVSCNPSAARPAGPSQIPFWESGMHAARVLSDDGARLYFESADRLAARDSNGRVDVYQWEELGSGGCDSLDAAFSPAAGGCVDLISSGQSSDNSRFVEASPTGNDVFLATLESLLPQDPGSIDIYDARLGGGLPIPHPPKPPCEGDACHAQIPTPEESTPASSDYVAPSRAAAKPARRRCAKGKRRVSAKGKSRCVAKHKRQRAAKRRRAAR